MFAKIFLLIRNIAIHIFCLSLPISLILNVCLLKSYKLLFSITVYIPFYINFTAILSVCAALLDCSSLIKAFFDLMTFWLIIGLEAQKNINPLKLSEFL